MSWNVLLTAGALEHGPVLAAALELLEPAGCKIEIALNAGMGAEPLAPRLNGIDAVLAGIEPYPARLLESDDCSRLKVISRWGVGFDAVDVNRATGQGILVCNTPGLLDEAVADYAFGLLLAVARRIPEGVRGMASGIWAPAWGVDVNGATLGIVGLGRIGKAMARRARGFGMRLLASDPLPQPDAGRLGVEMVSLDELLAESDFVSIHTALTGETRGLIGRERFQRMKPTARLINTARGAVIDEPSLIEALQEGWIAGAAVDAFCTEPLPPDSPLLQTPNLLVTPHQASFGEATGKRVSHTAAQAIIDASTGILPEFIVNPDAMASAHLRTGPLQPREVAD